MPHPPEIKVLLVDDDPEDLELTEDALRGASRLRFKVTSVNRPEQGLELLVGGEFDVALVDFQMGATDGLELLRKAREMGSRTPVILLTGHQTETLAKDALDAGVDDYLEKGTLDPALLERVVMYVMERVRAYRELDDAAKRIRFMLDATPGIAWEANPEGDLLFVSRRWPDPTGDVHFENPVRPRSSRRPCGGHTELERRPKGSDRVAGRVSRQASRRGLSMGAEPRSAGSPPGF